MKALLVLLLIFSPKGFAQGAFMFGDAFVEPAAETTVEPPVETPPRIEPVSPVRSSPPPPADLTAAEVSPEDSATEAGICENCVARLPIPRPEYIPIPTPRPEYTPPKESLSDCLRKVLLESAQSVAKKRYGNRPYSGGMCARGVGHMLHGAGLSPGYRIGDAISWHTNGLLKNLGFKNIKTKNMTAANAPPGAVLIFRGPATNMKHWNGGLPARKKRRGRSAGNWVGHVTIKGEKAGRYYTDGRTEAPAVANRTLVAVYVPETCGKNCSGKARKACR